MTIQDYGSSSGVSTGQYVVWGLVSYVLSSLAYYFIFRKAGQPAWAGFVPIYNLYVMLKTVGRPGWWLILYIIPIVNVVVHIVVMYDLAKSFGHGVGFTIGLIFLSLIFLYILGLGSSTYQGAAADGYAGGQRRLATG